MKNDEIQSQILKISLRSFEMSCRALRLCTTLSRATLYTVIYFSIFSLEITIFVSQKSESLARLTPTLDLLCRPRQFWVRIAYDITDIHILYLRVLSTSV